MIPGGSRAVNKFTLRVQGVFAVNEEYWMEALFSSNGRPEHVKCVLSPSAGNDTRHSTSKTGFLDKFPEPFAAVTTKCLAFTAPST
jgi:hypothetical protein